MIVLDDDDNDDKKGDCDGDQLDGLGDFEGIDFDDGEADWAPEPGPSNSTRPIVHPKENGASAGSSSSSALPGTFEAFHEEQERIRKIQRQKAEQLEQDRRMMVENFVSMAQDMFENISVPYLEKLMEETRPKVASEDELVDTCMDVLFGLKGQYPKADIKGKRKRIESDDEDDEDGEAAFSSEFGVSEGGSSSSSAGKPRDYMDSTVKMSGAYSNDR